MPAVPFVVMREQFHQLLIAQLLQIHFHGLGVVIDDAVNPAVAAVVLVGFAEVALLHVVPVDDPDLAVGAVGQVEHLRPLVAGQEEVGPVMGDEAAALGFEQVDVEAVAVDVVHEDRAAIFLGPGPALIDHAAGVGVAAAELVGLAAVVVVPLVAGVVAVVGDRLDVAVGVGIEVLGGLPLVASAGNDVEDVRDDAGGGEEVAVLVVVEAPGVAGAVGKGLERVPHGMIAPDAGVELDALVIRRARLAELAVREDAVAAIEPAIRPPDEAVERFVRVFVTPAIEEDGRAGGDVFGERADGLWLGI